MTQEIKDQLTTADLAYGRREAEESEETISRRDSGPVGADTTTSSAKPSEPALLPDQGRAEYQERWTSIQTKFIDEPKVCVQEADSLVAEVIQQLAANFAEQRKTLELQWGSGEEASTEDLRQALQHYRSFFQRLLAA